MRHTAGLSVLLATLSIFGKGSDAPHPIAGLPRENYAFESHIRLRRWDKPRVTLHVADPGTGIEPGDAKRRTAQAASLWNEATGDTVYLVVTEEAGADITVRFVPASSLPPQAVGRTTTLFRSVSGTLVRGEVRVREDLSEAQSIQAIAHELGHALGIQGHSDEPRDLMYFRSHLPAVVTRADANTLRIAYSETLRSDPDRRSEIDSVPPH
ncbi:MAG: hypothetical protein SFU56_04615 [Capsulimonadales bacterium]|nr:hypothetical protein [Capsulimonadales bacterium]